jgi:hypothetical protein
LNVVEVFSLIFAHSSAAPAEKVTNIRREPLGNERDYEDKKRAVQNAAHTNGLSVSASS